MCAAVLDGGRQFDGGFNFAKMLQVYSFTMVMGVDRLLGEDRLLGVFCLCQDDEAAQPSQGDVGCGCSGVRMLGDT